MMSGFFAPFSRSSARLTASGAGMCLGAGSTTLIRDFFPRSASMVCGKSFAGRAAGNGGADRARDAHADVLGVQHAEGGLGERLGDGQLVHLLVVTLLEIDDLALAGAAHEDHREAIDGGVG